MSKGDGWAVKRYVCPICKRRGLYLFRTGDFHCMYKNCESKSTKDIINSEVYEYNPLAAKEGFKYKP
ncbi:MAG: hypothetical protein RLZZ546_1069 [Bacteroidota bacterium]|jgi:hypothetical protein